MQKGYKRDGKGLAVVRFFIGLIFLAIIVCVGYFFLSKVDYSDKIKDPNREVRSYVEITPDPKATAAQTGNTIVASTDFASPTLGNSALSIADPNEGTVVDLTATDVPETQKPTEVPTEAPTAVPTPTPEPTPEPTKIPKDAMSKYKTKGFTIPAVSTNAKTDITKFYVSSANNNAVVQLEGFGYINDMSFDGATAQLYPVVTRVSDGSQVVYQASMKPGLSGESHAGAVCANPGNTDFECFFDVSKYADGDYTIGVVIYYTQSERNAYSYHEFADGNFTVTDGKVTDYPNI